MLMDMSIADCLKVLIMADQTFEERHYFVCEFKINILGFRLKVVTLPANKARVRISLFYVYNITFQCLSKINCVDMYSVVL